MESSGYVRERKVVHDRSLMNSKVFLWFLGLLVCYLVKDSRHAGSVLGLLVYYLVKDSRHAGSVLGLLVC